MKLTKSVSSAQALSHAPKALTPVIKPLHLSWQPPAPAVCQTPSLSTSRAPSIMISGVVTPKRNVTRRNFADGTSDNPQNVESPKVTIVFFLHCIWCWSSEPVKACILLSMLFSEATPPHARETHQDCAWFEFGVCNFVHGASLGQ